MDNDELTKVRLIGLGSTALCIAFLVVAAGVMSPQNTLEENENATPSDPPIAGTTASRTCDLNDVN